jgi:hypothetical protein
MGFPGKQHLLNVVPDDYHLEWNEIKRATEQTKECEFFRMLCQLSVVYSLNKAPWCSAGFWQVKRETLEHLIACGPSVTAFQRHLEEIADELGQPVPRSPEEEEDLFRQLVDLPCVASKGPPVGQCKWFSFLRAADFHHGQMFQQLVLLSHYRESVLKKPAIVEAVVEDGDDIDNGDDDDEANEGPRQPKPSMRSEWAKLKRQGENSLEVAIRMISGTNIELQRIFLVVCGPSWKVHGRVFGCVRVGVIWNPNPCVLVLLFVIGCFFVFSCSCVGMLVV